MAEKRGQGRGEGRGCVEKVLMIEYGGSMAHTSDTGYECASVNGVVPDHVRGDIETVARALGMPLEDGVGIKLFTFRGDEER